ncbi:MAG TPA: UDP-3-O-(3-hydroxymyristoyl)glucosamine N-acyltransferase [Deinococcales bacterium]|nr:UDP-3-O-(3-hydroxymyristoyl)glucosamine N-acyltransferase [Deinococcales bacterium]
MSAQQQPGLTAGQVERITGGQPLGPVPDGQRKFRLALPGDADGGSLVVAWERAALGEAAGRGAGLVVATAELLGAEPAVPAVAVTDARRAFALLSRELVPDRRPPPGVAPSADVHTSARLGADVRVGPAAAIGADCVIGDTCSIGAGAVIGAGTSIGAGSVIHPGAYVYPGVQLGRRVILHSGSVIGADGFGFVASPDGPLKIEHLGTVTLADDVEVGAGTTIDRGTLGATAVGARTKIDNLVQVGHNVTIGTDCLIAGQSAIGGSTVLGSRVTLAGNAAIADHVVIEDDAVIGALSGVNRRVPAGEFWFGIPAEPRRDWVRRRYLQGRLGEIWDYVKGQRSK